MERAYSEDLQKEISAKEAVFKAKKGILSNPYNFHCPDCYVKQTCTNFPNYTKGKGISVYFKCSNQEETHDPDCEYASDSENQKAIEKEVENMKNNLLTNSIVNLKKANNKNKSKTDNQEKNEGTISRSNYKQNHISYNSNRTKSSDLVSIKTIVELYNNSDFNNDLKLFKISKQYLSLNDIFLNINNLYPNQNYSNHIFIFHGYAKVEKHDKNSGLIEIKPQYGPKLFTNSKQAFNKLHTKSLKHYAKSNEYFYFYFRGYLIKESSTLKYEKFNRVFFLDLLIE
ncbi:hypothetical protein [Staphylococcus equorum]|uniref:hypothetical protein n=2 Tax=Staphylococcus equorum TaxID=246432 RepID=UPI002DB833EB|nr:hypothetical protein [Staphylococcus equorum]MEB7758481.1 hypothetical protein [Staphylococcus equorum]MEB7760394.1 hypothetical protein [Staphylococcus equorum]